MIVQAALGRVSARAKQPARKDVLAVMACRNDDLAIQRGGSGTTTNNLTISGALASPPAPEPITTIKTGPTVDGYPLPFFISSPLLF